MSYKKYLLVLSLIAIFSWAALLLVIVRLKPCESAPGQGICASVSSLSFLLFFLSLFFALTSTFTIMGFYFRIWFHRHEIYLDHFNISLRQGLLLSLCALLSLAFLILNVLTWWSGLFLVLIIVLIELYFTRAI